MNEHTLKILDYETIKETISTYAMTESGRQRVLAIMPLYNVKQIQALLAEVDEASVILGKSSSVPISGLDGIETIVKQFNKGVALRTHHFTKLLSFIEDGLKMKRFMKDKEMLAPRVSSYVYGIEELPEIASEIRRCIRNGRVDDISSKELSKVRKQLAIANDRLKDKLNTIIKSAKYKSYLQDAIVSERGGRFCVSVKKEYKGKIKGSILDSSASGSTLYVEPEEAASIQDQINLLLTQEEMESEKILSYLTGLAESNEKQLLQSLEVMVHYDVLFAKAKYSRVIGGSAPAIHDQMTIFLKNARHPLIGDKAIPLNLEIGKNYQALVITGPNTGGKTVVLKTVGLLVLMAQSGFHIPAEKESSIGIYQQILLDIGDGQSIEQNLSTFSSHITNIISILKKTNEYSLVLLDELGSGTDPGEGMGLASVILEKIHQKGATMLATTHYSEIKDFAEREEGFINGSMDFDIETLQPTYSLKIGKGGESQAFSIALRLGMHPELIEKAHAITYKENKKYGKDQQYDSFEKRELEKQVSVNRYKAKQHKSKQIEVKPYNKGDNVLIKATNEHGIVYNGPDNGGNYMVFVKGVKRTINQKRIQLHISAEELYPEDYDFDIIFESAENRKKAVQMRKKHSDLTIDHE
ncbi:endonuclease MutS2 [Metabacillus idriensis]|uniref:endonuclease MutS2 n=1 Tax=Metabacillus idriensis TaxID=324768 RepID=UPI00174A8400|nr:endonuclease MutS2 [Metabacillus idriensis]